MGGWSGGGCWDGRSSGCSAIVNFQLAGVSSSLPFEGSITGDTLSIDFIGGGFGAFALLGAVVPVMSFLASELAGSIGDVPDEWLEALDAFTAQIDGEFVWADALVLGFVPDVIGGALAGWLRGFGLFALVGFWVELGAGGTGDAIFLVQIEDWGGFGAVDTH